MAQRLHQFSHRTEEHELELWHRLGGTVALPEMEHRLTSYQQRMENKYDQFTQWLSDFINQEISQFGQRLTLLEGTSQNIQDIGTQAREVSQAMSEQVDKVGNHLESIRSNMKTKAYLAVSYKIKELKAEVTSALGQK